MRCTVCKRDFAHDLSMCPGCGTMQNDSVREELAPSITPIAKPRIATPSISKPMKIEIEEPPAPRAETLARPVTPEPKPPARRVQTTDLTAKKTSRTLAEFVNANAAIPDWRIELQNKVRKRAGRAETPAVAVSAVAGAARGAAALNMQYSPEPETENAVDLKVANALKRIEQSRRTYLPTEKAREGMRVARAAAEKNLRVVPRSVDLPAGPSATPAAPSANIVRPRLVSSMKIEKKEYDTNKLVPIPEAAYMATSFDETEETPKNVLKKNWSQKIEITESKRIEDLPAANFEPLKETDDLDDLAPISMRFNAGLFDLIIGAFAGFALFSPFLGWSENWASFSGFLLFATIFLAVMFVYLTASIAFLGQTFGMKLFSLEIVDVEQSEFPTLHQAAVSSSVYLLSLVFGGLGFIPLFFNEEKRAAHDIVSGTILVRAV